MSVARSTTALAIALGIAWGGSAWIARAQISSEASAHLSEVVSVLQREWLFRERMDWKTFRQRVFEKAGTAQTIPETYDAIRLALTMLGDRHTWYRPSSGETIHNPQSPTQSTGECTPAPFALPGIPADVGYVRIQITPQTPAAAIQEALRKGEAGGPPVGWIVDLRNSRGGNMWPALAGIGSLLGEGIAGFFVDARNEAESWGYTGGSAWEGQPEKDAAFLEKPYTMARANPRVAVLTDIGAASSGEAIAIAFRGRPDTRSFGTPTCGLSTAVEGFPLKSGGMIGVMTTVMADRSKRQYGGAVEPDELVTDPAQVVPRAVAWLRQP
jgi:peptidase S41-like protein